jgi:alkyldihydroxyacetonephosphate synthase
MVRLSDDKETETSLILSGKETLLRLGTLGLEKLGYGDQRCLLIVGVTGDKKTSDRARKSAIRICRKYGGLYTGKYIGKSWEKNRFLAPYLRNSLWEAGYALDTLETAVPWKKVEKAKEAIIGAITQTGINLELPILVFGHLSHAYPTGASIYITYMFKRAANPEENLERWQMIKNAASQAIVSQGGTISHQHGIGRDHANYLSPEKGALGIEFRKEISSFFDPCEVLNPQVMNDLIKSDRDLK